MPDRQFPGTHVDESPRGPRPITGVTTSTAALLGETERGSLAPRLVTSSREYQYWFGDVFADTSYLPLAVRAFFDNGGTRACICRVVADGATTAEATFGDVIIRAAGPGAWGTRIFAKVSDSSGRKADGTPIGFRLQLAYWSGRAPAVDPFSADGRAVQPSPDLIEEFDDLVSVETLQGRSALVVAVPRSRVATSVDAGAAAAGGRPRNGASRLQDGGDGPPAPTANDYRGRPTASRSTPQGLAALHGPACRDVSLVYAPAVSDAIAQVIVADCEADRRRFAIIDGPRGVSSPGSLDPRQTLGASSWAAFYYPWIVAAHPRTGVRLLVPPGGSVLGVYARVDAARGVFKAPANEVVRGALDLEHAVNDRLQETLNPKGVNVVRAFPGRGILVWGARTLSPDNEWKYVNVRRYVIFLERSIDQGTQWVVFEPNDEPLWTSVRNSITEFLLAQWQRGALQGQTPREAFYVRCDRTTMTQHDIDQGRLICEIGVAPTRPAEFVVLRIGQRTATAP